MTRVLIVDDCPDSVFTMSCLLARFGHEVQAARSGNEALKLASVFQPEVIFLDLWMPLMDGYDAAKRLRQIEGLDRVKIIAVSGANPDPSRLKDAGIDTQLLKPAGLERMLEAMGDQRHIPQLRRR